MRIYLTGPNDRAETKEFNQKIVDYITDKSNHSFINVDKKGKIVYGKLEDVVESDVLITRIGPTIYDDMIWAAIGVARAGNIPIIPCWNEGFPFPEKNYGFTQDIIERNKPLMRKGGDTRPWPCEKNGLVDLDGILEDLEILNYVGIKKMPRPKPSETNLELPPYIVGDSRNWENQVSYFKIENEFRKEGIEVINPSKDLDGYHPKKFPNKLTPMGGGTERCVQNASTRSSMVIGRINLKNLMGARFEEGVAYYYCHPVLYLDHYVFPGRDDYTKAEMHQNSIFKQNKDIWGLDIKQCVGRVPADLAPTIRRLREEYRTPK